MENIQPWCLSRQLWWGHQIPAYYLPSGEFVVAKNLDDAFIKAKKIDSSVKIEDLRQDNDVLDTWFSSWLWPISVFDGINNPDNEEIKYYYPTNDLVTAPEIIFFWVARMIIAGYEYRGELPFKNVYFTGIVRDKQRRKMSKSLGNSPDPIKLMKKYGADGVRTGMLFSAPAGNDLLFDEKLCEQGRNFSNKLWNAFRLIEGLSKEDKNQKEEEKIALEWIESKFNEKISVVNDHFLKYRISDALLTLYKFVWEDFCNWFLEIIKPDKEESLSSETHKETIILFEKILQSLHPFMPFITEELWHLIQEKREDYIINAPYPKDYVFDNKLNASLQKIFELVTNVRKLKSDNNIKQKEVVEISIINHSKFDYSSFENIINKLSKTKDLKIIDKEVKEYPSFLSGVDTIHIKVKKSEGSKEDTEKQIQYLEGFLISVNKKLENKRFVENAPKQVIENEIKKRDDALEKIESLKKSI